MRNAPIKTDVVIVGAGVAGCAAAIALRRHGLAVTLIEKTIGPSNRFCGEFVSGEALRFVAELGALEAVEQLGANHISRLGLYPMRGAPYALPLANEGFGLSRRSLDRALLSQARSLGAQVIEGVQAEAVEGGPELGFRVLTKANDGAAGPVFEARAVVGAQGKRSPLDRVLGRKFVGRPSKFVGVKCHYRGVDRGRAVELYLFPGGYCGVAGVEGGLTNLCMLATHQALAAAGGRPEALIEGVRRANPHFAAWFGEAEPVPGSLLCISQIPFVAKEQVVRGIFMAGDSAGLPAPFLGLGVAAGICSAMACADHVAGWLGGGDFASARRGYEAWWRGHFRQTQRLGYLVSRLLCRPTLGELSLRLLNRFPQIGEAFYRRSRVGARAGAVDRHVGLQIGGREL
jgi:flavin-dependent dehydrogenase